MPAAFTQLATTPFPIASGQTAHRFAMSQGGRTFVAEAVRADVQPPGFLVLEVSAWEVEDVTGATVTQGGVPVAAPPRRVSIHLDALAEGLVTLDGEIARATQDAAERLRNLRVQLDVLSRVPMRARTQP